MENCVRILPLGGCCEIGMNMTLFNVNGLFYIVDCGVLFPEPQHVGVDYIIPSIQTLIDAKIKIQAWLITHGHEDHIGGLPFIYPRLKAPLYSTQFTLDLIKGKFDDHHIKDYEFHPWVVNKTVKFPHLQVTPFTVNHSIPAATGLLLETPNVNILHTGDFRIDFDPPEGSLTHENIAKVIENKKIHLYMADSTSVFSDGHDHDEKELLPNFVEIFETARAKVFITAFASNVWRMKTILEAARQAKRKVYLLGRSLDRMAEISHNCGVIEAQLFKDVLISSVHELKNTPPHQLVVLCTGSQGEEGAALFRLVTDSHQYVDVNALDTVVFSSRPIPGNERKISALMNLIVKKGADIITSKNRLVHVSGHGYKDDLMTIFKTVRPKFFMPLHGEYRFLKKHIEIAEESGIPFENCVLAENGDIVYLTEQDCYVEERSHIPRDFVCQGMIYQSDGPVYKTREAIAKTGIVLVTYLFDSRGQLLKDPQVQQFGLDNKKYEIQEIKNILNHHLKVGDKYAKSRRKDHILLQIEQDIQRYFNTIFGYPIYTIVNGFVVGEDQPSKHIESPARAQYQANRSADPRKDHNKKYSISKEKGFSNSQKKSASFQKNRNHFSQGGEKNSRFSKRS